MVPDLEAGAFGCEHQRASKITCKALHLDSTFREEPYAAHGLERGE
jgi:hypothetical protein